MLSGIWSSESSLQPPVRGVGRWAATWFLGALVLNLVGNWGNSLWDRDEPRFAEATREMIVGGDWIVPHFNGVNRYDKPILIYWLMSVPMRLFGVNEFSSRAFSSMAGAGTVALVFLLALRMGCSMGGASTAALFTMLSPLLLVISKASTTDATLTLSVVGAMAFHWEQERGGFSWVRHLGFWAILAISALTKGPPGIAVVGLAVVFGRLWGRRVKKSDGTTESSGRVAFFDASSLYRGLWRSLIGVVFFLLLSLPWAIFAWRQTGGEFFQVAVGKHVIERATSSLESHRGPIVYYIPVLLGSSFPLMALIVPGMARLWGERRRPEGRFLWCWLIPGLAMFSIAQTKLPHYVAPLVPAMALMVGLWWTLLESVKGDEKSEDLIVNTVWRWTGAVVVAVFGIGVGLALPVAVRWMGLPGPMTWIILFSIVMIVGTVVGSVSWIHRRWRIALVAWSVGMIISIGVGLLCVLPSFEGLRPSKVIARWIRGNAPVGTSLIAVDYQEPSLVFYWGDRVEMLGKNESDEGLRRLLNSSEPVALTIPEERWQKWLERQKTALPRSIGVRWQGRFYLFQKGKWSRLLIVGNWEERMEKSLIFQEETQSHRVTEIGWKYPKSSGYSSMNRLSNSEMGQLGTFAQDHGNLVVHNEEMAYSCIRIGRQESISSSFFRLFFF